MGSLRNIAAILLSALLIFGVSFYILNDKPDSSSQSASQSASPAKSSTGNTVGYVEYSDNYLETTSGTRLLFFHANWCPQCRQLEADIVEQGVPEGVTIIKVDYDSSQQLKQKYGVTLQTTVVRVDDQGNLVEKYVPYDEPTLANVKANLL